MGTEPDDQPTQPPSSPKEEPPPFEPDYKILTVLERGRKPDRERVFQRDVRLRQEQRPPE